MRHFTTVLGHTLVAALLVLFAASLTGAHFTGAQVVGSIWLAGLVTVAYSALTLAVAVFGLVAARSMLGLAQVGRLLQWVWFWVIHSLGLAVLGYLLPGLFAITSPFLAGFLLLACFLVLALVTGHLLSYRGRAWLPVRMRKSDKNSKDGHP